MGISEYILKIFIRITPAVIGIMIYKMNAYDEKVINLFASLSLMLPN